MSTHYLLFSILCHYPLTSLIPRLLAIGGGESGPKKVLMTQLILFSLASRRPTTAPVANRVAGSTSATGRGSLAAKKASKPSSSLLAKSPSSSTSSLSRPPQGGGTKGNYFDILILSDVCANDRQRKSKEAIA